MRPENILNSGGLLRGIWSYRGFILGSVKREFQSKYENAVLGIAWAVMTPLAMIFVYTIIFAQIMHSRLPGVESVFGYSIFLCSGVLSWGMFSEITTRGQTMFLDNANLIKKNNFPRVCLPIIVVLNATINFLIIFSLFAGFLVFSGNFPGWPFFAIFPLLVLQIMFSTGLALILGTLNVFFRDVGQFFNIFIQFWFWLTPIVYPVSILPQKIQSLLVLNPMAQIIGAFQNILVRSQTPSWIDLLPTFCLSIILCGSGLIMFRRRAGEMVDEL